MTFLLEWSTPKFAVRNQQKRCLASIFKYLTFTDCTAPFQVTVVTDATADATAVLSKGLCLDYVQTACTGNFFN